MRFNLFIVDHPSQQVGGAVGHVADQPSWLHGEKLLYSIDHDPGRVNFLGSVGARCFDINNHTKSNIDQVVRRVCKKCRTTWSASPLRRRIGDRNALTHCLGAPVGLDAFQILANRARRLHRTERSVINCCTGDSSCAGSIRLDHARIDRKAFATNETLAHASLQYGLKHMAEGIALAKATVSVLRERGMFRHRILDPQPTKPTIGQIKMPFFAQAPLRANPKTITNDQHPNHQLRIDRWSAGVAIKRGEVGAKICETEKWIDAPN